MTKFPEFILWFISFSFRVILKRVFYNLKLYISHYHIGFIGWRDKNVTGLVNTLFIFILFIIFLLFMTGFCVFSKALVFYHSKNIQKYHQLVYLH